MLELGSVLLGTREKSVPQNIVTHLLKWLLEISSGDQGEIDKDNEQNEIDGTDLESIKVIPSFWTDLQKDAAT